MNCILTIERTATLRVSVVAYRQPPRERIANEDEPDEFGIVDDGDSVELCAGTEVGVSSVEQDDETLCALRDGSEAWIEGRYL